MKFSNVNDFGSGFFGVSLDFLNFDKSNEIDFSFEPPGFGGNLDLYITNSFSSNYLATTSESTFIPEPFTILGAAFKRKFKQN